MSKVEINPVLLQWKLRIRMGIRFVGLGNPYADGSSMSIEHNAVVVKNGIPDFGSAEVTISAENPIKIVAKKTTFNGSEFVS